MMKSIVTVLCLSLTVAVAADSGREAITEASVRTHLEFLASDAMNGRGSGTRDEWIAAEYIGAQLRLLGLEPLGDDGRFVQSVAIERTELAGPPTLAAGSSVLTHGREVLVLSMSATRHSGTLQRYKKGMSATRGAAVIMPAGFSPADAQAIGDAALVLMPETPRARSFWTRAANEPIAIDTVLSGAPRPAGAPAPRPARVILEKEAYARMAALEDGATITLRGGAAPPRRMQTWNAIGQLKGRDRTRSSETILLSAHLDHIGNTASHRPVGAGADTINNGADDDASGCVAVLELAKVLAGNKRPRRTVIFAFFGSEEAGGYGSRYFVENPPVPLRRIVANIQFEMIGRPDGAVAPKTLWLTGYERSDLGPALARRGARLVKDPHPKQNFFFRSDNIAFARRGIVAHTVSSYGLHQEYHTPRDETRLVDYGHMTQAIRSMVEPIRWLANSRFRPAWVPGMQP